MARIASYKTLKSHREIRRRYAYNAIERAWFDRANPDPDDEFECQREKEADDALTRFTLHRSEGGLTIKEEMDWALTDIEYKELTS